MAGKGRFPAVSVELSADERSELEGLARRRKTAQGLARRSWIVLLAAEGLQNKQIAGRLGTDPNTVSKWRRRFAEHRCDGLYDEPRPGTPRKIGDDAIAEIDRKGFGHQNWPPSPDPTMNHIQTQMGIYDSIAAQSALAESYKRICT